ncbi:4-carboxy-4-hydroxy-2-oxoadipate aldolase/oxaloacetate decarboxylase (plasmid) [Neorhizobium galegae bv. officinalis bv. officinalis str. HAMBI 1141]|uniref:4-carboxy-4-hydroxy-2-oxoadipate aldolase/oxaloacetate decarboxylase n=1 Tax=Neorhizobium galegae bv. officinalis bv. officinalis str. HAMBI 1141 TaxID=1028801 RepID=A0A068TGY5_NEOGA|nr:MULTISPECIES: 4-hydroxy-4-methyl-2-oxoglutarate aldolase [Neorhizobium]MCJ9669774.1 RraA family protein [Neorhizobium sp. SHOUNA12B]MCJ9743209.1 RraA family protein [Neorhizobium sp. SHOUNA12A]CDN57316.1 4-carboxy-4-hydroxy-2-oxoadipate aldolase/oxaloacetate decarboxylase [Neorhizobium galegae bv. officinalis bv. officinalis str. HAMBI 1141]
MKKYHIGSVPKQVDPELIAKFESVEVATIGHFRHRGFVHHSISPVVEPGRTLVGTAVTVAIPATDSTLLHHAIGFIRPGDFLFVDRLGDDRHACIGGGVAFAIKTAGAIGVVLDGPCTDVEEILELDLPFWSRGVSGITTRLNDLGGSLNLPISCGNVPVMPGDIVVADASGVVVIPVDEAEDVVEEAIARQARAGRNKDKIAAGEKLGDLSGASRLVAAALEPK